MPGIRDDIIIKRAILAGMWEAAAHEAKEVAKHGLLASCKDLDIELHTAYDQFRDVLQHVIDEMKDRVTKKVIP
jgi:hypothetical protein